MTGVPQSAGSGQDAVALQPGAPSAGPSFPATSMRQSRQQFGGGELRRDRVHRPGQPAPVARHGLRPDHRRYVLRGLQAAVVAEEDQAFGGQVPLQPGTGRPFTRPQKAPTRRCSAPAARPARPQAAGSTAQPGEAIRPGWAFRRATEDQAASSMPKITHGPQVQPCRGSASDHHAVLVLSPGRDPPPYGQCAGQRGPDLRRIDMLMLG